MTDRALESSFSRVRFVSWFRARTDRMLESSFSRVRFVFLVQGNNWSNVGKLIFKSSIRFLGSRQRVIECWKARFQEFDSFSWFRATTDRMLESSFSRVRLVYYGSGQRLIECWKAHFQEFDSFSWFRARTDRMLESSFSRVRFVFFSRCLEHSKLIELLKTSFPTFDQSLPWTKKTNRTLENELSNIRSVLALNQENESNSWKWAFQHSISRCPEPRKRIELLKMSFPTFDQSLPWTKKTNRTLENELSNARCSGQRLIECWKARFQEFDSFTWFRARTDRMLESSFSRIRFVFLVQGNDWSNVGKLVFKSSISLLSVVALNQENESNSWKRAFQHSISPCPEPSKRIELLKTSFPTFDQSLPWTE